MYIFYELINQQWTFFEYFKQLSHKAKVQRSTSIMLKKRAFEMVSFGC